MAPRGTALTRSLRRSVAAGAPPVTGGARARLKSRSLAMIRVPGPRTAYGQHLGRRAPEIDYAGRPGFGP